MTAVDAVKLELAEMAKLGIRVPASAAAYVEANPDEIEGYREDGMKISEIADLVCNLADIAEPSYRTRLRDEAGPHADEAIEAVDRLLDQNPDIAF